MLYIKILSLIFMLITLESHFDFIRPVYYIDADDIIGNWSSPDQNSHFQIYKKNNKYFGKITWGTGRDSKDINNPSPSLRNRELIGLTILQNFVYAGKSKYSEGTIYDPNDGKEYSCILTLQTKDKLIVRGYVGIPLFGRSETWTRIKN